MSQESNKEPALALEVGCVIDAAVYIEKEAGENGCKQACPDFSPVSFSVCFANPQGKPCGLPLGCIERLFAHTPPRALCAAGRWRSIHGDKNCLSGGVWGNEIRRCPLADKGGCSFNEAQSKVNSRSLYDNAELWTGFGLQSRLPNVPRPFVLLLYLILPPTGICAIIISN